MKSLVLRANDVKDKPLFLRIHKHSGCFMGTIEDFWKANTRR